MSIFRTMIVGAITLGVLFSTVVSRAAQSYEIELANKISELQTQARKDLGPYFKKAGVPFKPKKIKFLAFKDEKLLELWALHKKEWVFIAEFPILAASGHAGPKLQEGDRQVPEGEYKFTYLNPHSVFDVSIKLNYPNAFDKAHAKEEHRTNLGGDIVMHGSNKSWGCLALGDRVIEDLFVLVHNVGMQNASIIIAPNDVRHARPLITRHHPRWIHQLNRNIMAALQPFQY